ncbi:hypothetical protein Tco_0206318 [Tanacetum coccineum]
MCLPLTNAAYGLTILIVTTKNWNLLTSNALVRRSATRGVHGESNSLLYAQWWDGVIAHGCWLGMWLQGLIVKANLQDPNLLNLELQSSSGLASTKLSSSSASEDLLGVHFEDKKQAN